MKQYPTRKYYKTVKICECGHPEEEHALDRFFMIWNKGKCAVCMCPKFKFEKEYKEQIYLRKHPP